MIDNLNILPKYAGYLEYAAEFNAIVAKINQINSEIGASGLEITSGDIAYKVAGDPVPHTEINLITSTINAILALNTGSGISDLMLTPETINSTWQFSEFNDTVNKINEIVIYCNGFVGTTLSTPANNSLLLGDTEITQSWDNVANESSFEVRMSDSSMMTSPTVHTVAADTLTYVWTGLINGVTKYFDVKAVGDGTAYLDSPRSSVQNGAPHLPILVAVTCTGNSNVEGTYGHDYPSKLATKLGGNYTVHNRGVGGRSIYGMVTAFSSDMSAGYEGGKVNILIAMDGTNTGRTYSGGSHSSWDAAEIQATVDYLTGALTAGYDYVYWVTGMPSTRDDAQDGNPYILYSDSQLRILLPGAGVGVIDIVDTLLGHFGSAARGNDSGYSSFGYDTPTQLPNANAYFVEGTHNNNNGYDILAKLIAVHIQHDIEGSSIPDLSSYGAVSTLATPVTITATPGDAEIVYTGTAVTGADGYVAIAATDSGFTTGVAIKWGTLPLTVDGLTNATPYHSKILAFASEKNMSSFLTLSGTVTPVMSGPHQVTWKDNDPSVDVTTDPTKVITLSGTSFGGWAYADESIDTNINSIIGYCEFVLLTGQAGNFIGLTDASTLTYAAGFSYINYGYYLQGSGDVTLFHNGTSIGVVTTYTSSDKLTIQVTAISIKLLKNGTLVHTYTTVPTFPLTPLVVMASSGDVIKDIKIDGATLVATP